MKKLVFTVILFFIASTIVSQAASINGWFYIEGQWRYGVLVSGNCITIQNGMASADPPYTFYGEDGYMYGSGTEFGNFPFIGAGPGKGINVDISVCDDKGITIKSNDPVKVDIYNLKTTAVTFTQSNVTSMVIDKEQYDKPQTYFLLVVTDKKGEQYMVKFMISNCVIWSSPVKSTKE